MLTRSNTTRSFTTTVLTTATSFLLALGTAQAQSSATPTVAEDQANAIVNGQTQIYNAESFVSANELLQSDVTFTPASVDINALQRMIGYPAAALKNNIFGRFELIVYVGSNGTVKSVNFVTDRSENPAMNTIIAAACDAVTKSRFTPASINKKAVSSAVRIPFSFVL